MRAILPDRLRGIQLIICGTAAGTASAQRKQYYAGPGNKFWRMLREVGLTNVQLGPHEYRKLVQFGIGLTDLVKEQFGADSSLRFLPEHRTALARRVRKSGAGVICFNGKTAAQHALGTKAISYGWQKQTIGGARVFVAPSTSGAAAGSWDPRHWRKLARDLDGRAQQ